MLNPPENIQTLANKWLSGTITQQEQKILDEWYEQQLPEKLNWTSVDDTDETIRARMFIALKGQLQFNARKVISIRQTRIWTIAAACVVLLIISSIYLSQHKPSQQRLMSAKPVEKADKTAAGNKAVLTLADGSAIILDNSPNGTVSKQGSTVVDKTSKGQLIYRPGTTSVAQAENINTLTTPKGGQYQLQLPDGSKVWLNAASSLKFPAAFGSSERRVELSGEAYFEIAKNAQKPFKVMIAQGAVIEVLGTHFNVMAYQNEKNVSTTLLEGSVKITKSNLALTIKPGQQAVLNNTLQAFQVDTEQEIAWQKGDFQFSNTDFAGILRELERWYDVDFVYEDLPSKKLNGIVSRTYNLSQVLRMLEITGGVQFKKEGRQIRVIN
ncbi:FecR family protein [Dyadobacter psychrotolerans]|uniref:DUF4974 domain-containing protein n=1 Tax=Dyadobacter psychrotolerans TaxID=2541721 RepID=A0A4R5DD72_9BACT|nr:FecR domain-containing protein [Dyadobacter psychrotolerans]TDE09604.1 DUF4974 domain-containing protein [Dyadobacter psychrotolerans]